MNHRNSLDKDGVYGAVTVIQCGDTIRTAAAGGKDRPSSVNCGPARPGERANVGAPCETNKVGIRDISAPWSTNRRTGIQAFSPTVRGKDDARWGAPREGANPPYAAGARSDRFLGCLIGRDSRRAFAPDLFMLSVSRSPAPCVDPFESGFA